MRHAAIWLLVIAGMIAVGCKKDGAAGEKGTKCPRVGVVDVQTLIQKLGYAQKIDERTKLATTQLDAMKAEGTKGALAIQVKLQKDLERAVEAVSKTRPDADQATLIRDPAVMVAAIAKYRFDRVFQAYTNQFPAALELYKKSLQESVQAVLVPAMETIRKHKGFEIILDKTQVASNSDAVDLTRVMEEYLSPNVGANIPNPPDWKTIILPLDKI